MASSGELGPLICVLRVARVRDLIDCRACFIRPGSGTSLNYLRQLGSAIGHLMLIGHLQTPRPDHWEGKGPRPTWLVEPRIHLA